MVHSAEIFLGESSTLHLLLGCQNPDTSSVLPHLYGLLGLDSKITTEHTMHWQSQVRLSPCRQSLQTQIYIGYIKSSQSKLVLIGVMPGGHLENTAGNDLTLLFPEETRNQN